jgi:predicted amidophosphoribosyltransferase
VITLSPEQLIRFGRRQASAGDYEEALEFISNLDTTEARSLKGDWSYQLAKVKVSHAQYVDAREHFAVAIQNHSNPVVRTLSQKRNELINKIIRREIQPPNDLKVQLSDLNIAPAETLHPNTLSPLIEFVGAPAAYRSAYDRDRSDALSRLLRRLKRETDDAAEVAERKRAIARLGSVLAVYAFSHTTVLQDADLIVPLPGDQNRLFERGYSIPLVLAAELARTCATPLNADLVEPTRDLVDLRTIPRWQRTAAVEGAFQSTHKATALEGLNIVVVDDVMTTGSTLNQIGLLLKECGCNRISALVLTHTEGGGF